MPNEITTRTETLPDTLPELAQFVLVGREKLNAVRAEIRAIDKIQLAREVADQKRDEARMLGEALLDAETRIGEMTKALPKDPGGRPQKTKDSGVPSFYGAHEASENKPKRKYETVQELGFTPKQVQRFETLADNPDVVEEVKARARENDDIPTRTEVLNLVKFRKQKEKEKSESKIKADNASVKILTALKAVLDLDVSAETLDAMAENLTDESYQRHVKIATGAQQKIDMIMYGLSTRRNGGNNDRWQNN